ncbi:MAG TPA: AMP-binding protein [Nocardioidaceae bacterium]|nr:AMP-binding protein [Nocardioidaceae bacterium]
MSDQPTQELPETTVLAMFRERVAEAPDAPALSYFGRDIGRRDLDELSDVVARGLADLGVWEGDRVAVSLQNTPAFPICLLAAWKLGAIVVPVNPMLRGKELSHLLGDCEPRVFVCHPDMKELVDEVRATTAQDLEVVVSLPGDFAGDMPGPWSTEPSGSSGAPSIESLLAGAPHGTTVTPRPDDVALLTYTSGTTGPSKGSMSTHANLTYQAVVSATWFGLSQDDRILTTAPFFHITGLGLHLAVALGNGIPMVLTYRFEPATVLRLLDRYRPTFTIGAITAFIALADCAEPGNEALSLMSTCFSGGAPVPETVVERYERDFGVYIHNIYGLTESTSACISVPRGVRAPVDETSGALSIGVALPGTRVMVVGEDGAELPRGTAGELVVRGPSVGTGYWNRPEETANAFRPEGLHTGDVGVMDEDGWIFVVDRKKDLLVVSGYKVWPREVEDVLYLHPAVREAAVVGRPDDYQGESVQAFVALRSGQSATAEELQAHCRENLSAYKCPRTIEFLDDLPKTATGKILRRELKEGNR